MMAKVHKSLKNPNQLELFSSYQPKINLTDGQISLSENHIKKAVKAQIKNGSDFLNQTSFNIALNFYNNRKKPLFPKVE